MAQPAHGWTAYVGVGSNLDSPQDQVEQAISAITLIEGCFLVAKSSLYRSAPMGPSDQPDFINAVVAVLTLLDPRTLLAKLQEIEQDHGRVRDGERWGPRTLDLDLLMHGTAVIEEPGLTLPHPGIAMRNFVLLPFAEIASDVVVPQLTDVATLAQRIGTSEPAIEKLAL
ncbi:MAG: 2-amino-4-hydroxy-6-hydroxymethyldihydropteridine diphosphokinase [Gammaproteobacteria bacterium]|nr:2-amino-4-hydroxy-6-hydroxymethyldihydropteridine diphosphokinase [Gammaproteobacteria bacterium]